MQNTNTPDTDTVSVPFWKSSQLYLRARLDDLAIWLPAQHAKYSPLVEFGYVLTSQGGVAAYNVDHALHCRSRCSSTTISTILRLATRSSRHRAQLCFRINKLHPNKRGLKLKRRLRRPQRRPLHLLLPYRPSRHLACRHLPRTMQNATSLPRN
eukprot:199662-Pleurochrysis_carterae.AAC.2